MKGKLRDVPEEHRSFVEEYQALLEKYPRAADRYALADRGADPARDVSWECEDAVFGDGTPFLVCRPVAKE